MKKDAKQRGGLPTKEIRDTTRALFTNDDENASAKDLRSVAGMKTAFDSIFDANGSLVC